MSQAKNSPKKTTKTIKSKFIEKINNMINNKSDNDIDAIIQYIKEFENYSHKIKSILQSLLLKYFNKTVKHNNSLIWYNFLKKLLQHNQTIINTDASDHIKNN